MFDLILCNKFKNEKSVYVYTSTINNIDQEGTLVNYARL